MPNPSQFTSTEPSGFIPPGYQPLRPTDIAKVKKSYNIASKPKFSKQTSDDTIYDFATDTVLNWWKTQQQKSGSGGTGGSGSSGGSSGGGSGAGGSGAGYGGGGTSGAGSSAPTAPSGHDGQAHYVPPPKPPAPTYNTYVEKREGGGQPLTAKQIADALTAAGHPEWRPPSYALVSMSTLNAWIARAKANTAGMYKAYGTIAKPPSTSGTQPIKVGGVQQ